MTRFAVAVPWRDRGRDWRRPANLKRSLEYWDSVGIQAHVFNDGRSGDAQFNRSACYNRAVRELDADILIFSEADLIVPIAQIGEAVELAREPGLVIPFSWFMAVDEADSERVRAHQLDPADAQAEPMCGHRQSIGAVNVVSRESLELVGGYDESFCGAWYDDTAMNVAFQVCCGPTRFADGDGYHLYHLPGTSGEHLTDTDRAATDANRLRYERYLQATTPEEIRRLTNGA